MQSTKCSHLNRYKAQRICGIQKHLSIITIIYIIAKFPIYKSTLFLLFDMKYISLYAVGHHCRPGDSASLGT